MFDPAVLLTFITTSIIILIVPGPNVTVVIANALSRGVSAGFAVIVGAQIGALIMMILVGLGFEALLTFMGWAFDWIKIIGAAYLIWLGVTLLRSRSEFGIAGTVKTKSHMQLALEGGLVLWSNPKAFLFFGAFLPQFITPDAPAFPQVVGFGLIFIFLATFTDGAYALLAGLARTNLSSARITILSRVSGVLLMLAGVWLLFQRKA